MLDIATVLNYCAMNLCFLIFAIGYIECSNQVDHRTPKPQFDQFVGFNSSVPFGTVNQTKVDWVQTDNPQRSSNTHRLSSRILLILKLLQLYKTYSAKHNSSLVNPRNSTTFDNSESRSVSSWTKMKNPIQRQGSTYLFERSPLSSFNSDYSRNAQLQPFVFPTLSDTNFYRHHLSPSSNHPNSYVLVPPITDTVGIDYWLKLIENASLDEAPIPFTIPEKEKIFIKHKYVPSFKRKNVRNKNRVRYNEIKKTNTKNEETFHSDPSDNQDESILLNNDINQNPSKPSLTKMPKVTKQDVEFDSSPRCDKFTDEICIDDFEYPEHAILDEIFKRKELFQLMYSEVKEDTPLVDGIPRDVEENFSQDYYYNNDNNDSEDYDAIPNNNQTLDDDQTDQNKPRRVKNNKPASGFVCMSEVLYAKPKLARNIKGKWRVIVNAGDFTQTVRMEKCTKPNHECRFIADHKYDSRCAQINSIHRLLVFEKGKGFYIDTFRIPTACTCHVSHSKSKKKINYSGESSSSASLSVKRDKSKSNLGETLWSILGTHPESKDIHKINVQNFNNKNNNNNPNNNLYLLSDQSKNAMTLDLLKLLPQLTSMAPENVLQQLLDGYSNGDSQRSFKSPASRPINADYQVIDLPDKYISKKNPIHTYLLSHSQRDNEMSQDRDNKAVSRHYSYSHPGTTTIVTPPRSGNNAPIVQVIHVPVSSSISTMDTNDSGSVDSRNPFHHSLSYSLNGNNKHYSNNNNNQAQSSNYFVNSGTKYSKQLISASDHLMQLHSKTDSTVASPPNHNETRPVNTEKVFTPAKAWSTTKLEPNNNQEENKDIKKIMNKKINFSYHPILEYLVN